MATKLSPPDSIKIKSKAGAKLPRASSAITEREQNALPVGLAEGNEFDRCHHLAFQPCPEIGDHGRLRWYVPLRHGKREGCGKRHLFQAIKRRARFFILSLQFHEQSFERVIHL